MTECRRKKGGDDRKLPGRGAKSYLDVCRTSLVRTAMPSSVLRREEEIEPLFFTFAPPVSPGYTYWFRRGRRSLFPCLYGTPAPGRREAGRGSPARRRPLRSKSKKYGGGGKCLSLDIATSFGGAGAAAGKYSTEQRRIERRESVESRSTNVKGGRNNGVFIFNLSRYVQRMGKGRRLELTTVLLVDEDVAVHEEQGQLSRQGGKVEESKESGRKKEKQTNRYLAFEACMSTTAWLVSVFMSLLMIQDLTS